MPQRIPPSTEVLDLVIDVAPARTYDTGARALGLSPVPDAAEFRRAMEEGGVGPAYAAAAFLEALVVQALEAEIGEVEGEAAGRVLLAEEVLLILTGSSDLEAVRAWLRAPLAGEEEGEDVG